MSARVGSYRPRKWQGSGSAAGASAGEAFIANVRAALAMIEANAAGAAAGRNPGYLHQVRIAVRRLRSTLSSFRPLLRRREADALVRALRETLHALGAARDWDVFLVSLRDRRLAAAARRASAPERRRARDMLRSTRFRHTLRRVAAWASGGPWRSGADPDEPSVRFARRALRHLEKRLRKAAKGIDWTDAAQRHHVRIRAKQLRYGCDCFAAVCGEAGMRPMHVRLRRLQKVLGELNDFAVQRALLRQLADDLRLQAPAEALRARLTARERGLVGTAERAWHALKERMPAWQAR